MSLRVRSYIIEMIEMTTSGIVPGVIQSLGIVKRARPKPLFMKTRRKGRLIKKSSKQFSPPLPPRI